MLRRIPVIESEKSCRLLAAKTRIPTNNNLASNRKREARIMPTSLGKLVKGLAGLTGFRTMRSISVKNTYRNRPIDTRAIKGKWLFDRPW